MQEHFLFSETFQATQSVDSPLRTSRRFFQTPSLMIILIAASVALSDQALAQYTGASINYGNTQQNNNLPYGGTYNQYGAYSPSPQSTSYQPYPNRNPYAQQRPVYPNNNNMGSYYQAAQQQRQTTYPGYNPQPYNPTNNWYQGQNNQNNSYPQQTQSYQHAPNPVVDQSDDNNDNSGDMDAYEQASEQASKLFADGQLTQSIALFDKAVAVAPDSSLPAVYNNIAVVYIRRGNYFHEHGQEDAKALDDFRMAYFYLVSAWPEGLKRTERSEANLPIAKGNLSIAYKNLHFIDDKTHHLEQAKSLRAQGKFPQSIVEYDLALAKDPQDPTAAKALGDLFTVVNMPEKSKKYYAIAANGPAPASAQGGNQADTLVQLGNAQYKTGETDKAIANFDKALALNPTNTGALTMLERIWKDELKVNPGSVLAHANLGGVYQKEAHYDQALDQYNAAAHFADQDPSITFDVKKQIRLNLGTLFQQQKNYSQALKAYETVLQVEPNHLLANYYRATALEESGNADAALQGYNRVLTIDPTYRPARDKLLMLAKAQTDPLKLAAGLGQFADRFPTDASVQEQIGEEFHQRKDLDNAAKYYQHAIALNPKMADAWANLGAVYASQGKDDMSVEAYKKATALDPSNAQFKSLASSASSDIGYKSYQQAVALQQHGKTAESLPLYQKALATNNTAEIHGAYGVALQTSGKLDDAIAEYRKAIALDAKNPDYVYSLGTAFQQKKDPVQAEATYKKVLTLKADYPEAKTALASLSQAGASATLDKAIDAYNKQSYPPALTLVDQAIAKNPQDPMAHYYKGLILDGQKKPALAAQSYQKAIQYKADFNDAYYALGVALDTSKDPAGARRAFDKFLQLSGTNNDDFVKYARERVKTLASK